jgi:hypothetical protein
MDVDNQLWMALELDLDPSKQGFGGDYPPTEPIDEVGPFNEAPTPASRNGFWTLVAYSGNPGYRPR